MEQILNEWGTYSKNKSNNLLCLSCQASPSFSYKYFLVEAQKCFCSLYLLSVSLILKVPLTASLILKSCMAIKFSKLLTNSCKTFEHGNSKTSIVRKTQCMITSSVTLYLCFIVLMSAENISELFNQKNDQIQPRNMCTLSAKLRYESVFAFLKNRRRKCKTNITPIMNSFLRRYKRCRRYQTNCIQLPKFDTKIFI